MHFNEISWHPQKEHDLAVMADVPESRHGSCASIDAIDGSCNDTLCGDERTAAMRAHRSGALTHGECVAGGDPMRLKPPGRLRAIGRAAMVAEPARAAGMTAWRHFRIRKDAAGRDQIPPVNVCIMVPANRGEARFKR
jgi:hypothetical protein